MADQEVLIMGGDMAMVGGVVGIVIRVVIVIQIVPCNMLFFSHYQIG